MLTKKNLNRVQHKKQSWFIIQLVLQDNDIFPTDIRGQSYDGASNMSGPKSGAKAAVHSTISCQCELIRFFKMMTVSVGNMFSKPALVVFRCGIH